MAPAKTSATSGHVRLHRAERGLRGLLCCQLAATKGFPAFRMAGFTWFYGDFKCASYNHAQEPNGRIPDAILTSGTYSGVATARSLRPGGVNSLMADGSVRFVTQSIARQVSRTPRNAGTATSSSSEPSLATEVFSPNF